MNIRTGSTLVLLVCGQLLFSQNVVSPDLQGYRKVSNYPVFTRDNLYNFIDGAADGYLAYGFEELNVTEYVKGKNTIKLEIYRHKDNTNAFGIYSSERSASFRFLNIGSQGFKAGETLNFFKGRYYVKIRVTSGSGKTVQVLETLALRVADALPGDATMPKTLNDFPESGRKANEETYINNGVLGHEFLKGAFRANYELADQPFSIFIIDSKDGEDCRKTVNRYLLKCKADADNSGSGKYVLDDGYNGDVFLSWKETRIVIIQGLSKDETSTAERYTSEILK